MCQLRVFLSNNKVVLISPLLVWGDSLLVLDLSLDILDGIRGLDLKGDGLAR